MNNSISIGGMIVVTRDEDNRVSSIEFLPDDELSPVLEQGSLTHGQLQMLRNAAFDYTAYKAPQRAQSTLLCKAAHGRISATRDGAYQLTLKIFASEAIDWQKAFVVEPIEVMTDLMGPERMREILKEQLVKL